MREENISEILHDALQYLDDEMIEEVQALRGGVLVEKSTDFNLQSNPEVEKIENPYKDDWKKEFRPWRKWAALAASVCLFVIVGTAWNALYQEEMGNMENASDIEAEMQDEMLNNGVPIGEDEADIGEDIGLHDYSSVQYQLKGMGFEEKKTVSEENLTIIDKFIESYRNAYEKGTVHLVDDTSWKDVEKGADGHLYLELSDGATVHFVLLGNGTICYYEIPSVWIEIDKRVYDAVLDVLRNEE